MSELPPDMAWLNWPLWRPVSLVMAIALGAFWAWELRSSIARSKERLMQSRIDLLERMLGARKPEENSDGRD